MHIILAGGSGFLGRALHARLQRDGHHVGILTRHPRPGRSQDIAWSPDGHAGAWAPALDGVEAVVNLSGASIDKRWTAAWKDTLGTSRVLATRSLIAACRQVSTPPGVLVNGSAVGYYGAHGEELVTEATAPGSDFLARLCVDWEREAEHASAITRVALIRTGLVLHPAGGALGQLLRPFRLGIGGPLGSGTQYMPWVHLDDWVDLVVWMMQDGQAHGAFNATAPEPVTNRAFTRALGRAVNRPAIIPVPGFALRVLLGEFAESLLTGQRAIPSRAQEMGFGFRFKTIEEAFRDLIP